MGVTTIFLVSGSLIVIDFSYFINNELIRFCNLTNLIIAHLQS